MSFRMIVTSAAYYPEYPDYDYDNPVLGFNINADILNIYNHIGIGASSFLKLVTYHTYFQDLKTYEFYLHNFFNYKQESSYFLYGLFGGVKKTDLYYEDYKDKEKFKLEMIRPLLGFHFSNEGWGFTVKWTQTEQKKSKWEYEVKFRNSTGIVAQIGGSFKGPITGVKSDFHIYAGYEFFI
ncbi:MAG: hypothetical protein JXB60_07345 [Candidatus Cloacimonetes bacterium]|nr:hypothetical protein [Candidatus Cloacimonadota bacterium]